MGLVSPKLPEYVKQIKHSQLISDPDFLESNNPHERNFIAKANAGQVPCFEQAKPSDLRELSKLDINCLCAVSVPHISLHGCPKNLATPPRSKIRSGESDSWRTMNRHHRFSYDCAWQQHLHHGRIVRLYIAAQSLCQRESDARQYKL